ncbi:hypothetical protein [Nocardia ignorata]|uniref:hypothetical protein n=1 Tax=Nocardia ignorata TaxID=145285 RepID=UPI000AD8BB87|nr:hypothetical protein [Nocardia ignorata]
MISDPRIDGPWADQFPDPVPVVHRDLEVRVGGWDLTTLTREHLQYWVGCIPLQFGNTFMVVSRKDRPGFIPGLPQRRRRLRPRIVGRTP